MKLVDILARELKVWPSVIDGLVQYCDGQVCPVGSNPEKGPKVFFELSHDWETEGVIRHQWQAAVDALKAAENALPEWNGEGLPPAGEWCEILSVPEPKGAWCKGKILYISKSSCVWCWAINQIDFCGNTFEMEFRPIRTPEQIAAEDRSNEARRILDAMPRDVISGHTGAIVEWMLADGYRKFEIVEGEL